MWSVPSVDILEILIKTVGPLLKMLHRKVLSYQRMLHYTIQQVWGK